MTVTEWPEHPVEIKTDEAVARLQAALDYIVAHPKEWNQSTWVQYVNEDGSYVEPTLEKVSACGTAACVAGRIALQAPELGMHTYTLDKWDPVTRRYVPDTETEYVNTDSVTVDGEEVALWDAVSVLLTGSDYDDTGLIELFEAHNKLENLFYYAQQLTGGRIRVPANVTPAPRSAYDEYGE